MGQSCMGLNKHQILSGPGPGMLLGLLRQVTFEHEERLENMESEVAVVMSLSKLCLICVGDEGNYPQVFSLTMQGINMLETFYLLDSEVCFTFLLRKRTAGV